MERTGAADYLALRSAAVANPSLNALAYSLFFVFVSVTSLNDVLMPKLKELFQSNYAEMTLVQFCFFTSYALVSIPAAYLIDSISYVRSVVVGLVLMAAGCLLFLPAAQVHSFSAFLGALFIIAAGVTVVQVSANPLVMALGRPDCAGSEEENFRGARPDLRRHGRRSFCPVADRSIGGPDKSRRIADFPAACYIGIAAFGWSARRRA